MHATLRLTNTSANILGAWASASAPVSSGCCMGRSCLMYSSWSNVTLPPSSLEHLSTIGARVLAAITLAK
eukprot:3882232-Pyramimonas_sp.AAC.1